MGFKEFFGIAGAASLAASSPVEKAPDTSEARDAAAQIHSESMENEPNEPTPQYKEEQGEQILSGTTEEVDSMTQEQIDTLSGPEQQ